MNCPQCDVHAMSCGCFEQVFNIPVKKNISSGEDAFLGDVYMEEQDVAE